MYVRKKYIAGKTIEIEDMFSSTNGKGKKRAKRQKPTPEKIQRHNLKLTQDKLRRVLNANFTYKDLHVILTYEKIKRPTPEQAKKHIDSFLDKMRYRFNKKGEKFKYINVSGYIDKDEEDEDKQFKKSHTDENIHHHLIMSYYDVAELVELWSKHGRIMVYPLDKSGNYTCLANYFIRHTKNSFRNENSPTKQMYSCSRNLIHPKPKVKKVKADSWRKEPVTMKGYYIERDSIQYGVSEITGYPYRFYRMIKIDPRE